MSTVAFVRLMGEAEGGEWLGENGDWMLQLRPRDTADHEPAEGGSPSYCVEGGAPPVAGGDPE